MKVKEYISVLLSHDPTDTIRQFRCIECGKIVFEYKGDVVNITYGEQKKIGGVSLIECDGEVVNCSGEWHNKPCAVCHKSQKVCVNGTKSARRCNLKYWVC